MQKHGVLHGELVADSVREQTRLSAVSSAFDYCRALNVEVFVQPGAPEGLCGAVLPGLAAIGVAPESNERRQGFTVGHELGHLHIEKALPYAWGEALANRFASALLMPAFEFLESLREHGVNLHAMQRVWRHSSLAAIAGRVGELVPHAAAAAWLELQPVWRRSSNEEPLDAKFRALELEALGDVYHRPRSAVELRRGPRIVRAWRTHAMRPRRAITVCEAA